MLVQGVFEYALQDGYLSLKPYHKSGIFPLKENNGTYFLNFAICVVSNTGTRGGGGQTYPEVQGNPYPQLKLPGFGPFFFFGGETRVHVQNK